MPIVQVHLMEGRSLNQKRDLVKKVTDAICEALETNPDKVKIVLTEMAPEHYAIAGKLKIDK